MKLTPLDIHHKEFGNSLRGYNSAQVDQFLDEVADEFERLFKENIDLSEKLEAANEKVRSYAEIEKSLHAMMLAAQQSAEETKSKAFKEADLLLRDAEIKAKELVQAALSEKQRVQAEFMTVKAAEDDFRMKFRELLEDYMRKIHEIPVSEEVASMVGIAGSHEPPSGTEYDFAAPSLDLPAVATATEPVLEIPAGFETPGDAPQTDAPASEASGRPRAHVVRPVGENTEPLSMDPPEAGFVQALTLGEVEGPDLVSDSPTFEEPSEFPRFGAGGERDQDLDIEEID